MADFPDAIYNPRTMVNRDGVEYDEERTKDIYAEDFNLDRDEIVAIEEYIVDKIGLAGWIVADGSWTYNAVNKINVPSGAGNIYSKGDKIKFTQHGTVKYFYVISVADTVLTLTAGDDYSVEDTATYAITLPQYSKIDNPVGFPAYFNFSVTWNLTSSDDGAGGSPDTAGRFKIIGDFCWFKFGDGSANWKKVGAGNVIVVTNAPVTPADTYTSCGTFSSEQGGAVVKDMVVRVRGATSVFYIESNQTIPDNNALYGWATVYYRF